MCLSGGATMSPIRWGLMCSTSIIVGFWLISPSAVTLILLKKRWKKRIFLQELKEEQDFWLFQSHHLVWHKYFSGDRIGIIPFSDHLQMVVRYWPSTRQIMNGTLGPTSVLPRTRLALQKTLPHCLSLVIKREQWTVCSGFVIKEYTLKSLVKQRFVLSKVEQICCAVTTCALNFFCTKAC